MWLRLKWKTVRSVVATGGSKHKQGMRSSPGVHVTCEQGSV